MTININTAADKVKREKREIAQVAYNDGYAAGVAAERERVRGIVEAWRLNARKSNEQAVYRKDHVDGHRAGGREEAYNNVIGLLLTDPDPCAGDKPATSFDVECKDCEGAKT